MNWSRAKTILIIFFICTNLFLLTTIVISTGKNSIVTDDIVSSTISVLKNNAIEINPTLIPRRTTAVSMVSAKNIVQDHEEFAKQFCGEDAQLVQTNTYSGSNGTLAFEGDAFNFKANQPNYQELTIKLNEQNAVEITSEVLKKFGMDQNTDFKTQEDKGVYTILVTKQKDGLYYFNSHLKVMMSQAGVTQIAGSWFNEEATEEKAVLKNVTGVLIDYISLTNRPTTQEKIVALDLGYSILEEGIYHKEITLAPCWRITLEDGGTYNLKAAENQSEE